MFWRKAKQPTIVIPLDQRGPFHAVWRKTNANLPDPGMDTYAYATLALKPDAIVNGAIHIRGNTMNPQQPQQPYFIQTVTTQGVPLTAGNIQGEPLFDAASPGTGYTDPWSGNNNVPYPKFDIAPAGEVF